MSSLKTFRLLGFVFVSWFLSVLFTFVELCLLVCGFGGVPALGEFGELSKLLLWAFALGAPILFVSMASLLLFSHLTKDAGRCYTQWMLCTFAAIVIELIVIIPDAAAVFVLSILLLIPSSLVLLGRYPPFEKLFPRTLEPRHL
ncbi:MAG: hypothetical protein EOO15_16360 [Chitinophagaceae bacterium]|nr:MAG: hypothetical protein EOO15_16360 [Chitinophagaceae bacterium]